MRQLPLLVAALLLGACAQATEVVLVVDTDLGVPGELERVEIDVLNDRTGRITTEVDFRVPGAPGLPLVLGITARRADAPVVVEVRGFLSTGEILVRDVRTQIVGGSSRMLRVLLARRCLSIACAAGTTCDETGCRDVDVPGGDLPSWSGVPGRVTGIACTGESETCNGVDDDCDDTTDEDFDLTSDPDHCGRCGHVCAAGPCTGSFCEGEAPVAIVGGGAHTCALRDNGNVACFGWNLDGQLGAPGIESRPFPVDLAVPNVVDVALGGAFTCLLDGLGATRCVGDGDLGALGSGGMLDLRTPTAVTTTATYTAIGAGVAHACGVTATGVECWGRNDRGQLGSGGGDTPTPVAAWDGMLGGIEEIAGGLGHTCALRTDGMVTCWGADGAGQLGDGTVGGVPTAPVAVVGLTEAEAIAVGRNFACALRMGAVWCWGSNDQGQLGSAVGVVSPMASMVEGITDAVAIASAPGATHVCALRSGGAVSCWGSNASGQLGDGTTTATTTPHEVIAAGATAVAVGGLDAGGHGHSCAVVADGAVVCWGDGSLSQNGAAVDLADPTPVVGLP